MVQLVCGPFVPWSICQVLSILSIFSDILEKILTYYKNLFCSSKTDIIEIILEIESMKIKTTKMKTDIIKMKTGIIKMESNQVSTIPYMLNIETRILQIKTEI